jgi:hypothetical protein
MTRGDGCNDRYRHCEERSDEAIQSRGVLPGLPRYARNDGWVTDAMTGGSLAMTGGSLPQEWGGGPIVVPSRCAQGPPRQVAGGVAGGGPLQPSASCFGLPGRGVLGNASIRGRLGYAHKTMHRMVLSAEGVAYDQTEGGADAPLGVDVSTGERAGARGRLPPFAGVLQQALLFLSNSVKGCRLRNGLGCRFYHPVGRDKIVERHSLVGRAG